MDKFENLKKEMKAIIDQFCEDNDYYYEINGWGQIEIFDQQIEMIAKIDITQ